MIIELASTAHHESLVDLLLELHAFYFDPPTATRPEVRTHLAENLLASGSPLRLVVAVEHEAVVGFAAMAYLFSLVEPGAANRKQCLLKELFVRSAHRGHGVGRRLVTWVAHHAVQQGCGRMDWNVKSSNVRGIGFYQSLGARQVADRLSFRLDGYHLAMLAQQRAS